TVHRAKGLEWERVFILDPGLIPSIWSVRAYKKDPDRYSWMMQEEANIRYVAITRAMKELTYITSKGWDR
ncbi:MAG: ATP-dependent helicase, partial [Planctomycetes bacterium]|nr:ATP-dependent helicase [Planctomycetota bacterium]